jgi:hypothetical protein
MPQNYIKLLIFIALLCAFLLLFSGIKKLVENPNMITDLGERLYETVKDKYDLNQVTHERASFYKSLIK